MRLFPLTMLLLSATACFGEGKDDTPCAERDPSACGGCAELTARELIAVEDTGGTCYDTGASEVVACMDTGYGCTAVISYAAPSFDDDCMWFSSGCTPEGWISCELEVCY